MLVAMIASLVLGLMFGFVFGSRWAVRLPISRDLVNVATWALYARPALTPAACFALYKAGFEDEGLRLYCLRVALDDMGDECRELATPTED